MLSSSSCTWSPLSIPLHPVHSVPIMRWFKKRGQSSLTWTHLQSSECCWYDKSNNLVQTIDNHLMSLWHLYAGAVRLKLPAGAPQVQRQFEVWKMNRSYDSTRSRWKDTKAKNSKQQHNKIHSHAPTIPTSGIQLGLWPHVCSGWKRHFTSSWVNHIMIRR